MTDRDIPSVPVTTLAGLNSLSDLLSELPVSDTLNNVSQINKSLLFHTLVANESNNLLSIRDDNLVRQLVNALEQTNSDNIELKSQYAIQQHGTNISSYPELLQGIYNYRPTVFNTPQRITNHEVHQHHQHQNSSQLQSQHLQQSQATISATTATTKAIESDVRISEHQLSVNTGLLQQQHQQHMQLQQQQSPVESVDLHLQVQQQQSNDIAAEGMHVRSRTRQNKVQQQQQPQPLLQTPISPQQHQQVFLQQQPQQQNLHFTDETQMLLGNSPQQQLMQEQKTQQQEQLPLTMNCQPTSVIQTQEHEQLLPATLVKEVEHVQMQQQQQTQLEHHVPYTQTTGIVQEPVQQQQSQPQFNTIYQNQLQMAQDFQQQQQLMLQAGEVQQQQPLLQQQQQIFNKSPQKYMQQQPQHIQQFNTTQQDENSIQQFQQIQQNVFLHQQRQQTQSQAQLHTSNQLLKQQYEINQQASSTSPAASGESTTTTTPTTIQGSFQNVLNAQRQQMLAAAAAQQQSQQQQNKQTQNVMNNNEFLHNNQLQQQQHENNLLSAQTADMSSDVNSLQQQHHMPYNQMSTVSTIPPSKMLHYNDSTTMTMNNMQQSQQHQQQEQPISIAISSSSGSAGAAGGNHNAQLRVCINRVKAKDALLLQKSIKKFVQKSPDMAKKMGLLNYDPTTTPPNTTSITDTFTMMKADEKRTSATKRKSNMSLLDDLLPEQIYSKPKVRRVERITANAVPKCSKEEVMRSQTYQQFMRNMEQIIELLDDTETPNFDADGVDDSIECISSKMLNTMSNDVAKLKAKQVLDSIPKNKLTLLINYAMRNVYLAKNFAAGPDVEDDIMDDDTMEKILNAMEACLLVCNIYSTAKDLKFLQEDNISMIIKFIQFQLHETIFPSYDAVYTVKSMKKSDSRKKSKSAQNHHSRNLQLLYSKAVELMKVFVTLFDKCIFIDTIVLPLSTLAVEPFFVDNIETLQFVCLELVTTIFRKEQYSKIRSSILSDILSSIDRLPSSKRNLRPFKLTNNGGNIQMVTALVLQLIQCATILPDTLSENNIKTRNKIISQQLIDEQDGVPGGTSRVNKTNHDVMVLNKYDVAISIGGNFLTTFLNKCKTRSNDTDFRPLFENFIHDLLATVNKPEWPASELLLSLLGTMLVRYVSNKTIEPSIRLVSLDYLGIVAARLRKDTVESRCKVHIIDSMIKSIKAEQEKEGDLPTTKCSLKLDPEEERTEFLQKILLDFLSVNAHEENLIWDYARHFYLAQWYRDIISQRRRITEGEKGYASRKKKNSTRKKRRKGGSSSESSSSDNDDNNSSDDSADESSAIKNNGNRSNNSTGIIDQELNLEIFNVLEERKKYLLNSIRPPASQQIKTYIDYTNAHLIAQYLATKRPFSQSFDGYLKKIILVVNEPSIGIRTRAMKCLANIVEVDPMVLKRKDMQIGVNQKFLDAAISVREAAVDLVGKFVLSNEELIDQYYDMLSTRILDTGVSVRKRVIKILRDICIDYPDFAKIPEICVKMIRRVNDEEGIQKLVTEVFMKMWFSPCRKDDKHGIQRKINQIIDVVNTAHDTGTTWLEGLLTSIFQPKESMVKLDGSAQEPVKKNTEPPQEIVLACQQLADGLVDRLIELEDTDNARMLGCVTTLHLLAKVRPQLLVRHAITIEPYLNIKCHTSTAPKFICAVADILEKVVPMVNYASESFLASLEEHLMLLVVSQNQAVVTSCVSCLGALVNKITKNYKLIRDCFQKFYLILDRSKTQVQQQQHSIDRIYTPMFRRSLFTIGILMRYFDFKSKQVIGEINGLSATICNDAFNCLIFFTQCSNKEIRKQALIALGSFCVMNDDYLTRIELKQYYCDLLRSQDVDASIKIICMRNIWIYLTESEMYMHNKEKEWEKQSKNDDLKEMNDVSSGMASRIIQLYLQEILDCFLHADDTVRLWAVKVVQIVLRQGLVHPVRMVPYLICLSTDSKLESAHRADALLKDIDKTYAGFVNMKVQFGLQLCFELQEILQGSNRGASATNSKNISIVRGYAKKGTDPMPSALNDFLYTLLRTTKPQRRALVQTVTKQFDDQKTPLRQMLYIADNLAYFPYVVQDEPLYLIHQIDLLISMAGTNLLSTFKECLKPTETNDVLADDDDEEDPKVLFQRLPDNTTEIQKCITSAQACMLLLILKEHLKEMYSLTDGKISRYSPSEQKIYEKAVTRKQVPDFNPKTTIEIIRKQQQEKMLSVSEECQKQLNDVEKMDLVQKYLDFKQLMLKLDPDDESDEEAARKVNNTSQATTTSSTPNTSFLNSTGANMSSLDDSFGGNAASNENAISAPTTPRHYNYAHMNNSINQQKGTPPGTKGGARVSGMSAPATSTRNTHNITMMMDKSALASSASSSGVFLMPTTTAAVTPTRKQPATRNRRKKRKFITSDDDSDEDMYDDE